MSSGTAVTFGGVGVRSRFSYEEIVGEEGAARVSKHESEFRANDVQSFISQSLDELFVFEGG